MQIIIESIEPVEISVVDGRKRTNINYFVSAQMINIKNSVTRNSLVENDDQVLHLRSVINCLITPIKKIILFDKNNLCKPIIRYNNYIIYHSKIAINHNGTNVFS